MSKTKQHGGFPPITDLAVPLGLTVASHWLASKIESGEESPLPSWALDNTSSTYSERRERRERRELDEMEGGDWTQVVKDLATPVLLTAGAHYLASSDDESNSGVRYSEMVGGNMGVAVLKTLDDLIVPLGLMTGSHLLQSRVKSRDQKGGSVWTNFIDLSVPLGLTLVAHNLAGKKNGKYELEGGSGLPIIADTTLGKWLSDTGVKVLSPQTLVPLGLVFILYMSYRRYVQNDEQLVSQKPNILDMADRKDLKRYVRRNNIDGIDTETRVPFALAMGPEVFKRYMDNDTD